MTVLDLAYHHVDVFSSTPFGGNSLAVFPDARGLSADQMGAITREVRHFESIFLDSTDDSRTISARIFSLTEELSFAGHPLIGAACVLHKLLPRADASERWGMKLRGRMVGVETRRQDDRYEAELDQGRPIFLGPVGRDADAAIADALGLNLRDLDPSLRPEVWSTGLRYVVVPVAAGGALARARIARQGVGELLASLNAEFVYVLAADAMEGRHWDHVTGMEDVATGSGAGCVAAYLRSHGRIGSGEQVVLYQGRFAGRPSQLQIVAFGPNEDISSVRVAGAVAFVGEGRMIVPHDH